MKKFTALLCAVLLCFAGCSESSTDAGASTEATPTDWRNTVAYDGNVYINKETKLLYSLDKGEITLWDNAGDGTPLQTLNYDTYCENAYDTVEFTDVNLDGHKDLTVAYSLSEENSLYNLWLWNSAENKFTTVAAYKTIYNPVVAEDGKSVYGEKDLGIFGTLKMTYTFGEDLSFTQTDLDISNASDIAAAVSAAFANGAGVEKTDGVVTLNEAECTVYRATEGEKIVAYIAYTPKGEWFIDLGCVGAYRALTDENGGYALSHYSDGAGTAFDMCSALYGTKDLTITRVTKGFVGDVEATAYAFSADGVHKCTVVSADNGIWYGTEGSLEACYVISAAGTAEFITTETYTFKSIYE